MTGRRRPAAATSALFSSAVLAFLQALSLAIGVTAPFTIAGVRPDDGDPDRVRRYLVPD